MIEDLKQYNLIRFVAQFVSASFQRVTLTLSMELPEEDYGIFYGLANPY